MNAVKAPKGNRLPVEYESFNHFRISVMAAKSEADGNTKRLGR